MTEITAERVGIGILLGSGIWLLLAMFISSVVAISEGINFQFDKWAWHTWFLFYAACTMIITVGLVLTPTLQLRVYKRIKRGKEGKSHREMTKEIYDRLVKKES